MAVEVASAERRGVSAGARVDREPAVSDTEAALTAALDSLGQAHHRPYSRA